MTNPALADLDTCRSYIVKRAAARRAARDNGRAVVADFVKCTSLALGILVLVWSFLCP